MFLLRNQLHIQVCCNILFFKYQNPDLPRSFISHISVTLFYFYKLLNHAPILKNLYNNEWIRLKLYFYIFVLHEYAYNLKSTLFYKYE